MRYNNPVMIYFDKATQHSILEKFVPLLRPEGLLFAGHSESFHHAADLARPVDARTTALQFSPLPVQTAVACDADLVRDGCSLPDDGNAHSPRHASPWGGLKMINRRDMFKAGIIDPANALRGLFSSIVQKVVSGSAHFSSIALSFVCSRASCCWLCLRAHAASCPIVSGNGLSASRTRGVRIGFVSRPTGVGAPLFCIQRHLAQLSSQRGRMVNG